MKLDGTPVENTIRTAIPGDSEHDRQHRVCLLRIAHAAENAEDAIGLVADWLADYLKNPDALGATAILHDFTTDLARCLLTATMELEKSIPQILALGRERQAARQKEPPDALSRPPAGRDGPTPF